jgi:hypothetical protein
VLKDLIGCDVAVRRQSVAELGIKLLVEGIAEVVDHATQENFSMNHEVRTSSHSSSICFRVCVGVASRMLGSHDGGSLGITYVAIPVRLSYSLTLDAHDVGE